MTEHQKIEGAIEAVPVTAPPNTMADLLKLVQADSALPATRRRDIQSAVRTICRLLHLRPEEAPASAPFLRRRLVGFHPKQAKLSDKRYRNIRAELTFALKRYVPDVPLRIDTIDLPSAWQELRSNLNTETLLYGLSRFIMFCSLKDIAPKQVADDTIPQFREWLEEFTLVKNPEVRVKTTVRLWNKASQTVEGWPQTRLTVVSERETYCVAWEAVPASFQQEVDEWLARLAGEDPLADDAPLRPLRPASLNSHKFRVLQAVSALAKSGVPLDAVTSLSVLVRVEHVKSILRFFLRRSNGTPTSQTAGIASCLVTIARHWIKAGEPHLRELAHLNKKVTPRQEGLTHKNQERLRQFDSDRNKALLLQFPQNIAKSLRNKKALTRKDALSLQIAVAVEILIMTALRLHNLASLDLDRNIVRHRDRRNERVHLFVPGQDVKNSEDLEHELPAESAALLDLYLRRARPLLDNGSRYLFPGAKEGTHKSEAHFSRQISKRIFDDTGLDVNVHLFRHIGAKLFLDSNPGGYEVVRRVLRHRSMDTTTKHYAGFETKAAARHYDEVILRLRKKYGGDDG